MQSWTITAIFPWTSHHIFLLQKAEAGLSQSHKKLARKPVLLTLASSIPVLVSSSQPTTFLKPDVYFLFVLLTLLFFPRELILLFAVSQGCKLNILLQQNSCKANKQVHGKRGREPFQERRGD